MTTLEVRNYNKGNGEYFGPEDELNPEDMVKCTQFAQDQCEKNDIYNRTKNLQIDDEVFRISNQNVALVSFIGPYNILKVKHSSLQFCIRGAYDSVPSAVTTARKIVEEKDGNKYDIMTVGMYEWVAIPPSEEFMGNDGIENHEVFLNNVIIKHLKDLELKKQIFEMRKNKMKSNVDINKKVTIEEVDGEEENNNDNDVGSESIPENIVEEFIDTKLNAPNKISSEELEGAEAKDIFDAEEILDQHKKRSQNWAVISLVGDLENGMALKIHGLFEKESDAENMLDKYKQVEENFDSYIVETCRWLPADPDVNKIKNTVYRNEKLNLLNEAHQKEMEKAEIYSMEARKKGDKIYEGAKLPSIDLSVEESTPNALLDSMSKDPLFKE